MEKVLFWIVLAGVTDGIYRSTQAFIPSSVNPAAITLVINIFAVSASALVLAGTKSSQGLFSNFTPQAVVLALIIGVSAFMTDYAGIRALTRVRIAEGAPLIVGFLFLTCALFVLWEYLKTRQSLPLDLVLGIGLIVGGSIFVSRYLR